MTAALHTSSLTSLPLLARGKVRDNYAVGTDRILMVASDRISAFDVVMGKPIPGKGALLTQMALWWFAQLGDIVPNHLTGEAPESAVTPAEREQVGRMLAEAIVGGPATAAAGLRALVARTGADEVIVSCAVFDPAARRRSHELLAEGARPIAQSVQH